MKRKKKKIMMKILITKRVLLGTILNHNFLVKKYVKTVLKNMEQKQEYQL
jgi:hypothetical protein